MKFKVESLLLYFLFSVICIGASLMSLMQDLSLNLVIFLIHLLLGFYFLIRISGGFFIQDARTVFLLAYTLYTIVLPISVIYDSQTILYSYSYEEIGVNGTLILSMIGLCGFNCALLKFQVPWKRNLPQLESINIRSTGVALGYLYAIILALLVFILSKGIHLTITVENGRLGTMSQFWVFFILLLNGSFLFFFANYKKLPKRTKRILLVGFFFYAYLILIPLGARRELLPIICLFIFVLFERYSASLKSILGLGFAAIGFLAIGGIRELEKSDISVTNVFKYILVNNEFSIPARHTIEYLRNTNWGLLYGWSYIYFPILFIPRDLLGGLKPYSLAWKTDPLFHTASGAAAFTPITEAYINFSWIGPFVVFFLLSWFFAYSIKRSQTHRIFYLLVFMKTFDFNRGEFALVIYEMFFMYASYYVTKLLTSIKVQSPSVIKLA